MYTFLYLTNLTCICFVTDSSWQKCQLALCGPESELGHLMLTEDGMVNSVDSVYRVSGLSCPEAGGGKSAILSGFPDVFS